MVNVNNLHTSFKKTLEDYCGCQSLFSNLKIIYITVVSSLIALFFFNWYLLSNIENYSELTNSYYILLASAVVCIWSFIFKWVKSFDTRNRRFFTILYSYSFLLIFIYNQGIIESLSKKITK